jgi:ATP-binding cassette subfamily B protein
VSGVLGRLRQLSRAQRRELATTAVVMVATSLATLAGPALVGYGIDDGLRRHDPTALAVVSGAYLVAATAAFVLERVQIVAVNRVGQRFLADLRRAVFDHLVALSMDFFEREPPGRLVARMTADVDALQDLLEQGLLSFVTSLVQLGVAVVVLVVLSPVLFGLVALTVPVLVLASRRFRAEASGAYLVVRERIGETLSSFQEALTGVRVIQAFSREEDKVRRFGEANRAQLEANLGAVRVAARFFPVVEATGVLATAAVVGVGGLVVRAHLVPIGMVAAFVLYVATLFDPVQQMSQLYNSVQSAAAALAKLFGLLDTPPSVREAPGARELPPRGLLELDDVSFSYPAARDGSGAGRLPRLGPAPDDGPAPALERVSLSVPAGERLALVGPTGAGKSTLAKLVARFYDPTSGAVRFGGVDLKDATMASLRRRIVLVPQEGFLFAGTVLDNVRLARPEATDDEVREALRRLGVLERLEALPGGLRTEIAEGGAKLSAGERQLVALGRAALADPAVLVLDEATASVDPGTEAAIEAALEALFRGRTVIVVAHRLTTAARADRVAMVVGGRLVEVGSHAELLARGGPYARLYASFAGAGVGS